jgi:hypothetical protein
MSPAINFDSWIELYNPTEQPINLSGMYLSDDGGNLKRWQSSEVYVMNVPTIARANMSSSYIVSVEQPDASGIREVVAQQGS